MSAPPFRTDALNPSSLPTASLGHLRPLTSRPVPSSINSSEAIHEEWNLRIDREVKAVTEGLKSLIDLSNIPPDPPAHATGVQNLHLKLTTARLIKSTQNIRDIAHELRLMLVLSDEVDTARRRDSEVREVREEVKKRREEVGRETVALLWGKRGPAQGSVRPTAADGELGGGTEVNDVDAMGEEEEGMEEVAA